jgi:hypothetical protein
MANIATEPPEAPSPKSKSVPAAKTAPPPADPRLSDADRIAGHVRPHRDAVVHLKGGVDAEGKPLRCPVTILRPDHASFHAKNPGTLDKVHCSACRADFPASQFVWHGSDEVVGT